MVNPKTEIREGENYAISIKLFSAVDSTHKCNFEGC